MQEDYMKLKILLTRCNFSLVKYFSGVYEHNKNIINDIIKNLFYLGNEEIITILLNDMCYELTFKVFENEHFGNLEKYKEYYIPFSILYNDNNVFLQLPQELLYINSRLKYINEVRVPLEKNTELQSVIYSILEKNNSEIYKYLCNNNNEHLLKIISHIHNEVKNNKDIEIKTALIKTLLNIVNVYPCYQKCNEFAFIINSSQNKINFINELIHNDFILAIHSNISHISNSLLTLNDPNFIHYILSHLNENHQIPNNSISYNISLLNENIISSLCLFISIIKANPKITSNISFPIPITFICKLFLLISPSQGAFIEIYQFLYSLIEILTYERSLYSNYFFNNTLKLFIKYLSIQIQPKFAFLVNQTLIRIIELFTHYIELNRGTVQYWLKTNKVIPLVIKCLNVNSNKHLILVSMQFIRKISIYVDIIFLDYLISEELLNVMIDLFEKNYNKQNTIFSTICGFFEGIKREKIILQRMIRMRIDFFTNDKYNKYFNNLIKEANIHIELLSTKKVCNNTNTNEFLSKKQNRSIVDKMEID